MNRAKKSWLDTLGLLAAIAMIAGPLLGWLRLLPGLPAFYLFGLGGLLAVIAAVSALVQSARGRGFGFGRAVALLAAILFIFNASAGFGVPAINDFTTDLADPPAFRQVAVMPENAGRDLSYPGAFAEIQRGCCADLAPARVSANPAQAFALALGMAQQMPGWEIVASDSAQGEIEAVVTSRVFGFRDYVTIRVRGSGEGSVIDVRSKSRDGRGDLGANASRIRTYVQMLQAGGSAS